MRLSDCLAAVRAFRPVYSCTRSHFLVRYWVVFKTTGTTNDSVAGNAFPLGNKWRCLEVEESVLSRSRKPMSSDGTRPQKV